MEFFNLFFTGEGWGWRLFGLCCLVSIVIDVFAKITELILDYKAKRYKAEIEAAMDTIKDNSTGATKDDVRS